MTYDPQAKTARALVSVAPSPAISGTTLQVDHASDFLFTSFAQTPPFKVLILPFDEPLPTSQNAEIAYCSGVAASTRTGGITVTELTGGATGPGVALITETTPGASPATNEVQTLTITADGGTYTLTFGANTTTALNWNDNAATIQAALRLLASIGGANVTVTGTGPFTITFIGTLANAAQPLITATSSLTNGGTNEVQVISIDADAGTFRASADGGTNYTAAQAWNVAPATLQTAIQGLAAVGAGNATVTQDGTTYTVTFTSGKGNQAISLLTVDGASLTKTTDTLTLVRAQDGTIARSVAVGDVIEAAANPTMTTYSWTAASGTLDVTGIPPGAIITASCGTADRTWSGIVGATEGVWYQLRVTGSGGTPGKLILSHEDAGAASANRFNLPGSQNMNIWNTESCIVAYRDGKWRLIAHAKPMLSPDGATGVGGKILTSAALGGGAGTPADDGAVAHTANNETITGSWTFSGVTVCTGGFTARTSDAGTNSVPSPLLARHSSSGVPTTNFGVRMVEAHLDSSANVDRIAGAIECRWTTATDGLEDAHMRFILRVAAVSTVVTTIDKAGTLSTIGGLVSTSPTLGAGYATGAGGTVTQNTNKSTGVTLNKVCGQVTMNGAALAASTSVSFTLTNSAIAATDVVNVSIGSGATANSYLVFVDQVSGGSCRVHVRNISAGSLSEALVLNFAVQKAATS